MEVNIVTKEDLKRALDEMRVSLLSDMREIICSSPVNQKEWLKSDEVRKLLKISTGTLQNLRVTGKLHPAKLGGTLYYKLSDIELLLSTGH